MEYDLITPPYLSETEKFLYRLRAGKITKVWDSTTFIDKDEIFYGKCELNWLDGAGSYNGKMSVSTPFFSYLRGAGIMAMPSEGDIVLCLARPGNYYEIIGFYSFRLDKSVKPIENSIYGGIRRLKSGEVLLKGNNQQEIYLDRNGNVRTVTYDQSVDNQETIITNLVASGSLTRIKQDIKQTELFIGAQVSEVLDSEGNFTKVLEAGKEIRENFIVYKKDSNKVAQEVFSFKVDEDGKLTVSTKDTSANQISLIIIDSLGNVSVSTKDTSGNQIVLVTIDSTGNIIATATNQLSVDIGGGKAQIIVDKNENIQLIASLND
jgi:hypothetical protein